MSNRQELVLECPDVAAGIAKLYQKFVLIAANEAYYDFVFVCKI